MKYTFNNYTFVHGGKEHLASGSAVYSKIEGAEDEYEASFDDVALVEVISPYGFVRKEQLPDFRDSVLQSLNRNDNLIRSLV